ncbi:hypothetical protein JI58_08000 [Marinosulfonomonas sp. PRT-SC04]|nr:hypothetical protein JI58_08000 [Marinosulfonomonas sp. PRT-SC04]
MNMVNTADVCALQWYAVRFKPPRNTGRRSVMVGASYETYRGRDGVPRKRPVKGTGHRVLVPELLLQRAGFDVFLPIRQEWRRINRYSKSKHLVSFPLLANWIFVGWPKGMDRWRDLLRLDLVTGVVGADGRPMLITQEEIDGLRRKSAAGSHVAPVNQAGMRSGHEYAVGDEVRIDYGSGSGPLDGLEATVVDINGGSARALVQFFGAVRSIEIDAGLLVPRRE